MAVNYAARYDKAVDEKFSLESQAALATNNSYSFTGVKSVNVYSVGTATMTNYTTTGDNRYGSPQELQNNVQEMAVTQDRSCSFTIDKKSRVQTPGVMEAGKALARQLRADDPLVAVDAVAEIGGQHDRLADDFAVQYVTDGSGHRHEPHPHGFRQEDLMAVRDLIKCLSLLRVDGEGFLHQDVLSVLQKQLRILKML